MPDMERKLSIDENLKKKKTLGMGMSHGVPHIPFKIVTEKLCRY